MAQAQDTDVRGDVYECLLNKISQSGINGQFRTPRHIISSTPARYILLMEPDEYIGKGDQKELGPVADSFFREANRSFNKYREQNTMGTPMIAYLEPGSFRLYKELQIASGISANQVKPVKVIDNQKKAKFFFGLSEGPYKAMRRVLFDAEQKLLAMDQLERENARMKLEIAELKKEL